MSASAARGIGSSTAYQAAAESKNTVKARLTPDRPRRVVENDEYARFARRVLAAYARRVAHGDIEALAQMATLSADVETAIRESVTGLRDFGYSWADIGQQLGTSRQAAQQRWGQPPADLCP